MLHADTKTFVTLATALLGLTVTFAQSIVRDSGRLWIGAGWLLLSGSVFAAFIASGKIQGQVRASSRDFGARGPNGWANAVFFLLLGGAVLIAVGAGSGLWTASDAGVEDVVDTAVDAVAEMKDLDIDSLEVKSLNKIPASRHRLSSQMTQGADTLFALRSNRSPFCESTTVRETAQDESTVVALSGASARGLRLDLMVRARGRAA